MEAERGRELSPAEGLVGLGSRVPQWPLLQLGFPWPSAVSSIAGSLCLESTGGMVSISWRKAVCGKGSFSLEAVKSLRPAAKSSLEPGHADARGHGASRRELGPALLPAPVDMDTACSARDGKAKEWGVLGKIPQDNQHPDCWLVVILPRPLRSRLNPLAVERGLIHFLCCCFIKDTINSLRLYLFVVMPTSTAFRQALVCRGGNEV